MGGTHYPPIPPVWIQSAGIERPPELSIALGSAQSLQLSMIHNVAGKVQLHEYMRRLSFDIVCDLGLGFDARSVQCDSNIR